MVIPRNHRLTEEAATLFKQTKLFPQKKSLIAYFEKMNARPRGGSVPTTLKKGEAVGEEIAGAFLDYVKQNPETVPKEILDLVTAANNDPLGGIFEEVETFVIAPPTEGNDPTMGGVATLAAAAAGAIFNLSWRNKNFEPPNSKIDIEIAPALLERVANTYLGYGISKNKRRLTREQAYEIGANALDTPEGEVISHARRMLECNPDTIRYAVSKTGERVGLASAYAVTKEAFDATLRGERPLFSHTKDEMVPLGNNIILHAFAEIPNSDSEFKIYDRRKISSASMLTQVAKIIDPQSQEPFRAASYEIVPINTMRMNMLGFQTPKCNQGKDVTVPLGTAKRPIKVVAFDPPNSPFIKRSVMMILVDLIRRIRNSIDSQFEA